MRIEKIAIKNFRIFENIVVYPKHIASLVGKNNSGKSTILRALEIFFENKSSLVSTEMFHNGDTTKKIEIELTFTDLLEWEREDLAPWLNNGLLIVKREIELNESDNIEMKTIAVVSEPKEQWLKMDNINRENITEWLKDEEALKINGISFLNYIPENKNTVGNWKLAIEAFVSDNASSIEFVSKEKENPQGYPNVLKGTLPEYIMIPAVRDISDATKISAASSFGRLLKTILKSIPANEIQELNTSVEEVSSRFNKGDTSATRFSQIEELEKKLNTYMKEIIDCELELVFSMPTAEEVMGSVSLYAKDGVRTSIDLKGHGLQRSTIFTILRAYSELKNQSETEELKKRATIFGFEEPELYLHPQLQRTLYKTLRKISENGDQIFYSTHSSIFVDIAYFDEVCILTKNIANHAHSAEIKQLKMEELLDDLKVRTGINGTAEGIREKYAKVFNSEVSEGFFADKVVIVEGPSEQLILPIYADCLGIDFDRSNISIVHSSGKGPIDRLLRVFGGFDIPAYVFFDGDKKNTDAAIKGNTLELLDLLGNPLKNIDRLSTVVDTNYAVLEFTLEELLSHEIASYEKLSQDAVALLGPIGKPLKHKYMANMISEKIANGEMSKNDVPATIKEVCKKIELLNTTTNVLRSS